MVSLSQSGLYHGMLVWLRWSITNDIRTRVDVLMRMSGSLRRYTVASHIGCERELNFQYMRIDASPLDAF